MHRLPRLRLPSTEIIITTVLPQRQRKLLVLALSINLLKVCISRRYYGSILKLKYTTDTDDGQHFLLRPELRPLHKVLMVTFTGTAIPGREWFEGRYENRDALVVTVLALNNKAKSSTVMVKLLPEKEVSLTVPMVYVHPYKPQVNDLCVPCKGRWKGQKMKLMSLAVGNRAICESEHGIHEEQIENLCGIESK